MAKKAKLVAVQHAALMGRVNARLAKTGRKLRKSRSRGEREAFGAYYITDTEKEKFVGDLDLETYARKLGALHMWEYLVNEGS